MYKVFKRLSVPLVVSSVVVLTACGSDSQEEAVGENGEMTEWPHDEITLIIPFDAGGSVDVMARGMAPYLEDELGVDVRIENHPGASAQIGASQFINSPDDGSVFFVGTQLYLSANIALQGADFSIDDFAMVNYEQFDPITITVHEDSPHETLDDLIEDIENNPGEISYTTIYGGALHLTGVLLEDVLDIELSPVFYDGGGEMRNALLGQHADFMIGNANGDLAIGDQARVLAVASEDEEILNIYEGTESLNGLLDDRGVEIPDIGSARFIAAHSSMKETNPELFDYFAEAYERMFESEAYQSHLDDQGADVVSSFIGPEESDAMNLELHELVLQYESELMSDEN
ncbi:tripartite tricarboxylate transporter substrate binding protein [Shouchella shacheensis]|uniref:tripartite tricarboxylate transporter substrate binding protein n=1 Tax=Shouchella shacheensis TaxID=1649580 RepID=UPI00074057B7|nr:tripartite tricarboxylate transporter substrate binding protein [Shouchella shacheensis]